MRASSPRWLVWAAAVLLASGTVDAQVDAASSDAFDGAASGDASAGADVADTATSTATNAPENLAIVTQAARALFAEGVQLTRAGRWEEARSRFRRALELRESPALHFNLALAAYNSGHFVEAIENYHLFLAQDDDPANAIRRREATTAVIEIERALATLSVTINGTDQVSRVYFDGQLLDPERLRQPMPLDPGEHVIEVQGIHGGSVVETFRASAGLERPLVLTLNRPAGATATGAAPAVVPRPTETPRPRAGTIQSQFAIGRVRRGIEERVATMDTFGRRRWENNFVFYSFQGTGNPVGVLGGGMRWAPRPWLDEELTFGFGHPFGAGLGAAITARYPWSYRYGIGLLVGISTNLTYIEKGTEYRGRDPNTCADTSSYTPVWVSAAIIHEWRVSRGFSYRLGLGLRGLVNNRELRESQLAHCGEFRSSFQWTELFFDQPTLDHSVLPVMPWLSFDVGYSL